MFHTGPALPWLSSRWMLPGWGWVIEEPSFEWYYSALGACILRKKRVSLISFYLADEKSSVMKSKIILQHRETISLAHSLSIWHICYQRKFYWSAKIWSSCTIEMSANWLLIVARLTLDAEEKWTCIAPPWELCGVGRGNPERPTKVPGMLCTGSLPGVLQGFACLIFTTSQRGWYYYYCFPVTETEAQKVWRILCKVTQLVSGRSRTWISSLSHWLPAVINVVSSTVSHCEKDYL